MAHTHTRSHARTHASSLSHPAFHTHRRRLCVKSDGCDGKEFNLNLISLRRTNRLIPLHAHTMGSTEIAFAVRIFNLAKRAGACIWSVSSKTTTQPPTTSQKSPTHPLIINYYVAALSRTQQLHISTQKPETRTPARPSTHLAPATTTLIHFDGVRWNDSESAPARTHTHT